MVSVQQQEIELLCTLDVRVLGLKMPNQTTVSVNNRCGCCCSDIERKDSCHVTSVKYFAQMKAATSNFSIRVYDLQPSHYILH